MSEDTQRLPATIKDFHAHLDVCYQCEHHPFGLCRTGARLLKEAATGKIEEINKQENHRAPSGSGYGRSSFRFGSSMRGY